MPYEKSPPPSARTIVVSERNWIEGEVLSIKDLRSMNLPHPMRHRRVRGLGYNKVRCIDDVWIGNYEKLQSSLCVRTAQGKIYEIDPRSEAVVFVYDRIEGAIQSNGKVYIHNSLGNTRPMGKVVYARRHCAL